jgi:hypothetical protein
VDRRQHFSLWYFVAVMLFMLMLQGVLLARHVETLAYSDFKTLLQSGRIKELVISDDMVSGTVDLRGAGALFPTAVRSDCFSGGCSDHVQLPRQHSISSFQQLQCNMSDGIQFGN